MRICCKGVFDDKFHMDPPTHSAQSKVYDKAIL
jgi:hypothetical protein